MYQFLCSRVVSVLCLVSILAGAQLVSGPAFAHEGTPIHGTSDVALSEITGQTFVLNEDAALTIYDPAKKVFELEAQNFSFFAVKPHNIYVSPNGEYLLEVGTAKASRNLGVHKVSNIIDRVEGGDEAGVWDTSYPLSSQGGNIFALFSKNSETLYILDSGIGTISRLDIVSGEYVSLGEIKGQISGVEISSDSSRMYVVTRNPNELTVYDLNSRAELEKYAVGSIPSGLVLDDTRKRVFVSNQGDSSVSVVDLTKKAVDTISVGSMPISLALAKNNGDVFVANNGDGSVTKITEDLRVTTVDVGSPAYARTASIRLLYSEVAGVLYMVNASVRELVKINPATLEVLDSKKISGPRVSKFRGYTESQFAVIVQHDADTLAILDTLTGEITIAPENAMPSGDEKSYFSNPHGIAIDHSSGRIFVSNLSSGEITVLNGKDYSLIKKIPTGVNPQVLYFNQKTKKLYVSDPVENTVTVVDTNSPDFASSAIPIDGMPRSLFGNEAANTIYVPLSEAKTLMVINGETNTLVANIDLGAKSKFPLIGSINEARNKIYIGNYGGSSISVVDGATNMHIKDIEVGNNPLWVRYVPTHDLVYAAIEGKGIVSIIDPSKDEVVQEIPVSGTPYRIIVDDKMGVIYVVHRGEKIVSVLEKTDAGVVLKGEVPIDIIGELDLIYNMVALNSDSSFMFITQAELNRVLVTKPYGSEGTTLKPEVVATIEADGTVNYVNKNEVREDGGQDGDTKKVIKILGFISLIVVAGIIFVGLMRRKKMES